MEQSNIIDTLETYQRAIYRHGSGHFRDDNFGNVMEHFYDNTGMTILILSWMYMHDKKRDLL